MDAASQKNSFYGITEISEKLGVSQKLVRRHIASGTLQSIKIGGVYKIPSQSLHNFINDIEIKNEELVALDSSEVKPKNTSKPTNNYKNNSKDRTFEEKKELIAEIVWHWNTLQLCY